MNCCQLLSGQREFTCQFNRYRKSFVSFMPAKARSRIGILSLESLIRNAMKKRWKMMHLHQLLLAQNTKKMLTEAS